MRGLLRLSEALMTRCAKSFFLLLLLLLLLASHPEQERDLAATKAHGVCCVNDVRLA